ncbi:hypothetical protein, partial [Thiolapillus sp.]|uniref:hypothetical protein n=1 Tax=Thiolapillus sp. TaxID=2017437 RepID=UPI0025F2BCF6
MNNFDCEDTEVPGYQSPLRYYPRYSFTNCILEKAFITIVDQCNCTSMVIGKRGWRLDRASDREEWGRREGDREWRERERRERAEREGERESERERERRGGGGREMEKGERASEKE